MQPGRQRGRDGRIGLALTFALGQLLATAVALILFVISVADLSRSCDGHRPSLAVRLANVALLLASVGSFAAPSTVVAITRPRRRRGFTIAAGVIGAFGLLVTVWIATHTPDPIIPCW